MLLDINSGESKTYDVALKVKSVEKPLVLNETQDELKLEGSLIKKDNMLSVFGDEVLAELSNKASVEDVSVPNYNQHYYLYKEGSSFKYVKDKPFAYQKVERGATINSVPKEVLQKGVRALTYSRWDSAGSTPVWMKFSLPYGGISKGSLLLGYVGLDGALKPLDLDHRTEVDLLEGVVYIRQDYKEEVKQILAHFDVEPLNISYTGYLTLPLTKGGLFGSCVQKDNDGDIEITRNGQDIILTVSYDCFIVPSDPYLIEVDGVNLLEDRYVPAYQPLLIRQAFNNEVENFMNRPSIKSATKSTFGSAYTSITYNNTPDANIFDLNQVASGLILYKADGTESFDNTRSAYIPLFSKQTLTQEA